MGEARRKYQSRDGVARTVIFDGTEPDKFTIKVEQDVEPILDSIHRDRELMGHGYNKLAARIPTIVVEDLIKRGIYFDEDAFKAWLNSDEAAPWRVWGGRL